MLSLINFSEGVTSFFLHSCLMFPILLGLVFLGHVQSVTEQQIYSECSDATWLNIRIDDGRYNYYRLSSGKYCIDTNSDIIINGSGFTADYYVNKKKVMDGLSDVFIFRADDDEWNVIVLKNVVDGTYIHAIESGLHGYVILSNTKQSFHRLSRKDYDEQIRAFFFPHGNFSLSSNAPWDDLEAYVHGNGTRTPIPNSNSISGSASMVELDLWVHDYIDVEYSATGEFYAWDSNCEIDTVAYFGNNIKYGGSLGDVSDSVGSFGEQNRKKMTIIIAAVVIAVIVIALIAICVCCHIKKKRANYAQGEGTRY